MENKKAELPFFLLSSPATTSLRPAVRPALGGQKCRARPSRSAGQTLTSCALWANLCSFSLAAAAKQEQSRLFFSAKLAQRASGRPGEKTVERREKKYSLAGQTASLLSGPTSEQNFSSELCFFAKKRQANQTAARQRRTLRARRAICHQLPPVVFVSFREFERQSKKGRGPIVVVVVVVVVVLRVEKRKSSGEKRQEKGV